MSGAQRPQVLVELGPQMTVTDVMNLEPGRRPAKAARGMVGEIHQTAIPPPSRLEIDPPVPLAEILGVIDKEPVEVE